MEQWLEVVNKLRGPAMVLGMVLAVLYNYQGQPQEENMLTWQEDPAHLITTVSQEEITQEELSHEIYVDVKGAVNSPGVYVLNQGSRVMDAIAAAGGLREDAHTQSLNQALLLEDQMMVYIYHQGEEALSDSTQDPGLVAGLVGPSQEEEGLVNINTADQVLLETLPGIGPKKAQAIIEYRSTNGSFQTVEEITQVSGIGPASYDKLKSFITVR